MEILRPDGWPEPRGYADGVSAEGRLVFVAGQIGWNERHELAEGFVAQAEQALRNVAAVLASGGASPAHVARMTWYVTDRAEYRAALRELGRAYRDVMGEHYPAMTLVEVGALLEHGAKVEIEATAVVPVGARAR